MSCFLWLNYAIQGPCTIPKYQDCEANIFAIKKRFQIPKFLINKNNFSRQIEFQISEFALFFSTEFLFLRFFFYWGEIIRYLRLK